MITTNKYKIAFVSCYYPSGVREADMVVANLFAELHTNFNNITYYSGEIVYSDTPCIIPKSDYHFHFKSPRAIYTDVKANIWQKETLLNLIVNQIPDEYSIIVCVDCDIRGDWIDIHEHIVGIIDCEWNFLQPFNLLKYEKKPVPTQAVRQFEDSIHTSAAFASMAMEYDASAPFPMFGVPGGAWVIRRDFWRKYGGLYSIPVPFVDTLMAKTFCKKDEVVDCNSTLYQMIFDKNKTMFDHFKSTFYTPLLKDDFLKVNYISGKLIHRYHGDKAMRNYNELRNIFKRLDIFNDCVINDTGLWEWTDGGEHIGSQYMDFLRQNKYKEYNEQ